MPFNAEVRTSNQTAFTQQQRIGDEWTVSEASWVTVEEADTLVSAAENTANPFAAESRADSDAFSVQARSE